MSLAVRSEIELRPDSGRVVARPHVPGGDPSERLDGLVQRICGLADDEVAAALADVRARFAGRHRDLELLFSRNAERVAGQLSGASDDRRALVGAYLTQEHAFQAAALTNPSMVASPDQRGVADGSCRFHLSLRAIGEGHISSITFRSGTVAADGTIALDDDGPLAETGERRPAVYERRPFSDSLHDLRADPTITGQILDHLPRHFDGVALEAAITAHADERDAAAYESLKLMRWLAASNYVLEFDAVTPLHERLLWPAGPFESRGMEDARFVRLTEDDGSHSYYATYTAYDGFQILPQLIETNDFLRFDVSTLSGRSAINKGMALFPRLIDGSYVALSRPDRENIHLLRSFDPRAWHQASTPLRIPRHPWETIQMGNCGSPIETDEGWIVLTHGVGPMRTYRIGALLLDLEDPSRVIGDLAEPLLAPEGEERDGYVPNVVYSCGGMRHGDLLVLPYGASDQRTRIATFAIPDLLVALREGRPAGT